MISSTGPNAMRSTGIPASPSVHPHHRATPEGSLPGGGFDAGTKAKVDSFRELMSKSSRPLDHGGAGTGIGTGGTGSTAATPTRLTSAA